MRQIKERDTENTRLLQEHTGVSHIGNTAGSKGERERFVIWCVSVASPVQSSNVNNYNGGNERKLSLCIGCKQLKL